MSYRMGGPPPTSRIGPQPDVFQAENQEVDENAELIPTFSDEPPTKKKWLSHLRRPLRSFVPICDRDWTNWNAWRCDATAGFVVACFHIPQAVAYSALAGVPVKWGLALSTFPSFLYAFFGTSIHASLGTFAIVSIMVGQMNVEAVGVLAARQNLTIGSIVDDPVAQELSRQVLCTLTMGVGGLQLFFGLSGLSWLLNFYSPQAMAGFTHGAAVHVICAQLARYLGITLPRREGKYFKVFFVVKDVIVHLFTEEMNWTTCVISSISFLALLLWKWFCVWKNVKVPVPIEIVLITLVTALTALLVPANVVTLVGNIPSGMVKVQIPTLDLQIFLLIWPHIINIFIVITLVHITMCTLFAKKHHYRFNVDQEFLAFGVIQLACTTIPCWPAATAMARSVVNEQAGNKTSFSSAFSSFFVFICFMKAGWLIGQVPKCVLAPIILAAILGVLMTAQKFTVVYRVSKSELVVPLVTFLSVVVFNPVVGLVVGAVMGIGNVALLLRNFDNLKKVLCNAVIVQTRSPPMEDTIFLKIWAPLVYINAEKTIPAQIETIVNNEIRKRRGKSISLDGNDIELSVLNEQKVLKIRLNLVDVAIVDYTGVSALFNQRDAMKNDVCFKVFNVNQKVLDMMTKYDRVKVSNLVADINE